MSDLTVQSPGASRATSRPDPRRHLTFRLLALAVAVLFLVGFGVWQSILTPWVTFPDPVDHGWPRTPELHRVADSVSAAVMGAIGVVALLLALRPRGRSTLTAWLVVMLAMVGLSSVGSSLVQEHDLGAALLAGLGWFAVVVLPLALAAPDRTMLRVAGAPGTGLGGTGQGRQARRALVSLVAAGAVLAVGSIAWRLSGGIFEDPREDDVFGLVLLGIQLVVGGLLCRRGGQGWRTLAAVLAVTVTYVAVAVVSLALR